MIKKIFIIMFVAILSSSCGKKGDPIYNEENQTSKADRIQLITVS